MKLAIINSSPKMKNSVSSLLINDLKQFLDNSIEISEINLNTDEAIEFGFTDALKNCDSALIALPVYIDSVPSNLLYAMAKAKKEEIGKIKVYSIVNSGFTGGKNCEIALDIVKNWCKSCGFDYMGGVGYGGGGGLAPFRNLKPGEAEKESLLEAFKILSRGINRGEVFKNYYTSINIDACTYKEYGEAGWRRAISKNGLTEEDLSRKV